MALAFVVETLAVVVYDDAEAVTWVKCEPDSEMLSTDIVLTPDDSIGLASTLVHKLAVHSVERASGTRANI